MSQDRIRVLEIISGFAIEGPLGGIERFGIELAQALDPTSIEPIICGLWAYGSPFEYEWVAKLESKGIRAFIPADWDEAQPYNSFIQAYQNIRQIMRNEQVDVIHSHCQFGDVLALLLKKPLQAKTLIRTVHNEREWGKRPLRRFLLTNFLYPLLYHLEMGVAQQVTDNLDGRLVARLLRKKSIRAYNALNLQRFEEVTFDHSAKRASLKIPPNAQIVGTIGRLTKQKGYSILLEAAALVHQQRPHIYFMIIGNGELEESLKKQARELGIHAHVLFTGPRNDVEELLKIMNLFVSSSLWEGLPTVMLESMAANTPIVATKVSGNTELIQHGITGHLVAPNDAHQLASAIMAMLDVPQDQLAVMCQKAHQFARDNFSINQVAQQHRRIYLNSR